MANKQYTNAQLAAGVTALEFCRGLGIPLSDETVAGIVYDHMTAVQHKPLTIYLDGDAIDVDQVYRGKGFENLPPTPTMTGLEIRNCGWKKQYDYQMFIDCNPSVAVGDTEAIALVDGMLFFCIPPHCATPELVLNSWAHDDL